MMVSYFIQENISMRASFSILMLINMKIREFIHSLKKPLYLKIILKNLPMFDIIRNRGFVFYFHLTLDFLGESNLELTL
jgi:hypothetical protein